MKNWIRQGRFLWIDVRDSIQKWEFWFYLGWNDIAKQYRRSILGPIWITLNTGIFIIAFGMIGAQLFNIRVEDYIPYFSVGHILFGFLSASLVEGCLVFPSASAFLKQTPYPKCAFVFRVVWRNLILLFHNMLVVTGILTWAGKLSSAHWVWFFFALCVTVVNSLLAVAIIGAIATRFRDIPQIVTSFLQIGFFVTPVMWRPEQLTERAQMLVTWNPLAAHLDILRQPLLGGEAGAASWLMAGWTLIALSITFVFVFLYARRRIVYWL